MLFPTVADAKLQQVCINSSLAESTAYFLTAILCSWTYCSPCCSLPICICYSSVKG